MRASPTTPALTRRSRRAVETFVSTLPTGRGLNARLQRRGRRFSTPVRFTWLGVSAACVLTALVMANLQVFVALTFSLLAIAPLWISLAGAEGHSNWFRTMDRAISNIPVPFAMTTMALAWCSFMLGTLCLIGGEVPTGVQSYVTAGSMAAVSVVFSTSVFTTDRTRARVLPTTLISASFGALTIAAVLVVVVVLWRSDKDDPGITELIAIILAVLGLLGFLVWKPIRRRTTALTGVLRAADDLSAALRQAPCDTGAVLRESRALDRALSTRLTIGPFGVPIADARVRTALLSIAHLLVGSSMPTTDDKAMLLLQEEIARERPETLTEELVDYCTHIRSLLGDRADIAA